MDMRMPVMDGLEATRILKGRGDGMHVIIVGLSAHVLGDERNKIAAAGCDDFLAKPYRENEIFDMMAKHLALTYEYEDMQHASDATLVYAGTRVNLATLGNDVCAELAGAVRMTDAIRIADIAERLKEQEPETAKALHVCARNFDYAAIRAALEQKTKEQELL
jgi:YesN/AraC family two-component response regulator